MNTPRLFESEVCIQPRQLAVARKRHGTGSPWLNTHLHSVGPGELQCYSCQSPSIRYLPGVRTVTICRTCDSPDSHAKSRMGMELWRMVGRDHGIRLPRDCPVELLRIIRVHKQPGMGTSSIPPRSTSIHWRYRRFTLHVSRLPRSSDLQSRR